MSTPTPTPQPTKKIALIVDDANPAIRTGRYGSFLVVTMPAPGGGFLSTVGVPFTGAAPELGEFESHAMECTLVGSTERTDAAAGEDLHAATLGLIRECRYLTPGLLPRLNRCLRLEVPAGGGAAAGKDGAPC